MFRETDLEEVSLTWTRGIERGRRLRELQLLVANKLCFPHCDLSPKQGERWRKLREKNSVGPSCLWNAKRSRRG